MPTFSTSDHAAFLAAARDPRATAEERDFLATCASLAAARETVSRSDYSRAQALTGGHLSREGPISSRPALPLV